MIDAAVFDEDDHSELLHGVLVARSPQGGPHARIIQRLICLFEASLAPPRSEGSLGESAMSVSLSTFTGSEMRLAAAVVVLLMALPALAQDASWGVFPGVRFGRSFSASDAYTSGGFLEGHLDGIYVLPGDTFAAGLSGGYVLMGLGGKSPVEGVSSEGPSLGYEGFTLTPMVMFSPTPLLWLELKGGMVFGDIEDASAKGYRFGGGISWAFVHNLGADLAAHLEVFHTSATADSPNLSFEATSVTLGFTFSFFANLPDEL